MVLLLVAALVVVVDNIVDNVVASAAVEEHEAVGVVDVTVAGAVDAGVGTVAVVVVVLLDGDVIN